MADDIAERLDTEVQGNTVLCEKSNRPFLAPLMSICDVKPVSAHTKVQVEIGLQKGNCKKGRISFHEIALLSVAFEQNVSASVLPYDMIGHRVTQLSNRPST